MIHNKMSMLDWLSVWQRQQQGKMATQTYRAFTKTILSLKKLWTEMQHRNAKFHVKTSVLSTLIAELGYLKYFIILFINFIY